jgi:hypothetical protein
MEQTMRVKIPTDPDPKDAPHSNNGDVSFMPYVSAWERLPEAIRRVTAGGRPKEQAQIDLCRAIADGKVNIRCKLKRHTTGFTSKAVLEGKDFEIRTEIKPASLDWETSCPVKPWLVRRGSYSIPGYWDLELIEVCTADVTKALCVTKEQDESTRHASSQEMPVGSGRRSTARPSAAGPARPRGARPLKLEQTKDAMRNDIHHGRYTVAQLRDMLEKDLKARYRVSRDTARKARNAVMSELNSRQIPTNDN